MIAMHRPSRNVQIALFCVSIVLLFVITPEGRTESGDGSFIAALLLVGPSAVGLGYWTRERDPAAFRPVVVVGVGITVVGIVLAAVNFG